MSEDNPAPVDRAKPTNWTNLLGTIAQLTTLIALVVGAAIWIQRLDAKVDKLDGEISQLHAFTDVCAKIATHITNITVGGAGYPPNAKAELKQQMDELKCVKK